MKSAFLTILILVIHFIYLSQSISCGVTGSGDHYWNIEPDLTISLENLTTSGSDRDTIKLDLDQNGVDDLRFLGRSDRISNFRNFENIKVEPLNQAEISVDSYDSCYTAWCEPNYYLFRHPMMRNYSQFDIIGNNSFWFDSISRISYEDWDVTFANGCGYNCSGSNFSIGSGYIGVRRIYDLDTGYAWIKIKDVTSLSITIEELGYNDAFVNVQELEKVVHYQIYPNPANTKINILSQDPIGVGVISDLSGRALIKFDQSEVDISELLPGRYFIRIEGVCLPFVKS